MQDSLEQFVHSKPAVVSLFPPPPSASSSKKIHKASSESVKPRQRKHKKKAKQTIEEDAVNKVLSVNSKISKTQFVL